MLPPLANIPATDAALVVTTAHSQAWRVGTVLEALALSPSSAGAVRLQIGARVITAKTSLEMHAGQSMRLKVAEAGSRVVLRPVVANPVPERIRTAVREALPRQAAQAPLIATVRAALTTRALPAPVTDALTLVEKRINTAREMVSPEGVRRAVREAGNFLEQRLAQQPVPAVARDWKAGLLQLRSRLADWLVSQAANSRMPLPAARASANPVIATEGALAAPARPDRALGTQSDLRAQVSVAQTPAPAATRDVLPPMRQALPAVQPPAGETRLPADPSQLVARVLEQAEGALARVRLNQLVTLTPDPVSKSHVWLLELPVRHADGESEVVPLRIERDERERDGAIERGWSVDLAFDLADRGTLRARVALHGGNIYASLQADNPATREQIEQRLGDLEAALIARELKVGCLSCGAAEPEPAAGGNDSLLDARA